MSQKRDAFGAYDTFSSYFEPESADAAFRRLDANLKKQPSEIHAKLVRRFADISGFPDAPVADDPEMPMADAQTSPGNQIGYLTSQWSFDPDVAAGLDPSELAEVVRVLQTAQAMMTDCNNQVAAADQAATPDQPATFAETLRSASAREKPLAIATAVRNGIAAFAENPALFKRHKTSLATVIRSELANLPR